MEEYNQQFLLEFCHSVCTVMIGLWIFVHLWENRGKYKNVYLLILINSNILVALYCGIFRLNRSTNVMLKDNS